MRCLAVAIPLEIPVMMCGSEMEVVKLFDACIEDLIEEIKEIEEGLHDHHLEFMVSYPIKPEYLSKIGLHCRFPPPPRFPLAEPIKIPSRIEEVIVPIPVLPIERRPARIIKKRKLDGDDAEGTNEEESHGVDHVEIPHPKPTGRRPGRPRLTERVQPPPTTTSSSHSSS